MTSSLRPAAGAVARSDGISTFSKGNRAPRFSIRRPAPDLGRVASPFLVDWAMCFVRITFPLLWDRPRERDETDERDTKETRERE